MGVLDTLLFANTEPSDGVAAVFDQLKQMCNTHPPRGGLKEEISRDDDDDVSVKRENHEHSEIKSESRENREHREDSGNSEYHEKTENIKSEKVETGEDDR
jgi:hypothetical protein